MLLTHKKLSCLTVLLTALHSPMIPLTAGEPGQSSKESLTKAIVHSVDESIYDKIWGLTKFYDNKDNPIIQSIRLTGRYHGQYHWTDADTGSDDAWEHRRFRIGLEVGLFKDVLLKGEMESTSDFEDFYNGFTELYVQWKPAPEFAVLVGEQKPKFTNDWSTSSRYFNTFERSMLLNQFRPDYAPGVVFTGKIGHFNYYTGGFTNTPDRDIGQEFSEFGGGGSLIAQIGYDFKDAWKMDLADWRLEYLYSDSNEQSTIWNYFDHGIATSLALREGGVGLVGELLYGTGSRSDAFGINLIPSIMLSDKLQAVLRYQVAFSDAEEGLAGQSRYERAAGAGRGDLYQAGYAGFNYFLYGHKLKLMGGVEYANMSGPKGFDGWTALLGVRVFWGPETKGMYPTTRD